MTALVSLVAVLAVLASAVLALRRLRRSRSATPGSSDLGTRKPRVVIVGGGFAGIYAAQSLEELGGDHLDIVLVNKQNPVSYTHLTLPTILLV